MGKLKKLMTSKWDHNCNIVGIFVSQVTNDISESGWVFGLMAYKSLELFNTKAIVEEEQQWGIRKFILFPKSISPKMNVTARVEIELV